MTILTPGVNDPVNHELVNNSRKLDEDFQPREGNEVRLTEDACSLTSQSNAIAGVAFDMIIICTRAPDGRQLRFSVVLGRVHIHCNISRLRWVVSRKKIGEQGLLKTARHKTIQ